MKPLPTHPPVRRRLAVLLATSLSTIPLPGISGTAPPTPAADLSVKGSKYVEYQEGELPLIICAPHGGREKPESIPDRTSGTFAFDTNTQELVRSIGETFKQRSGKSAHLVICKLHRIKLDCNREEVEGAAGQPEALEAWRTYHGAIRSAIQRATDAHGGVFLIDIHGHGHKIQSL